MTERACQTHPDAGSADDGRVAARTLGDRDLVLALRANDPGAWDEFFVRFEPGAVRYARRIGIPDDVRDDCVLEAFERVLTELAAAGGAIPPSVPAYLARAVRNGWLNVRRGEIRRALRDAGLTETIGDDGPVMAPLVSEHARRHAAPPDHEPVAPSPVVAALARALHDASTTEEREMLVLWRGGATQKELAALLGIGYEAAAKRLSRLRRRLTAVAFAHAATLPTAERAALHRFLGRAGVSPPSPRPARAVAERPAPRPSQETEP